MTAEPPLDDHEAEVYAEPGYELDLSDDIVLRNRTPLWPLVLALGIAVVVLGFVGVVLLSGGEHGGKVTVAAPQPAPTPSAAAQAAIPPIAEADKGRLIQAMRGEAVHVETPSPTHLAAATGAMTSPGITDSSPTPPSTPGAPPHDTSPGIVSGDAAPPPLPIDQSLLSPGLTSDAQATSKRQPVRLAWDAAASGTPEQVRAIDTAGALVEQGNVPMARDVLRPAAAAGNAVAAYALGQTYDPSMLQLWQDTSAVPDVRQARILYRQAQVAGIEAAGAKLAALR